MAPSAQVSESSDCKHRQQAWTLRPDGAHIFEAQVLNNDGDTLFLVCADCIPHKGSLLGLSTLVQSRKARNSEVIFDLRNGNHVSRLLPFAACKCNPIDDHRIAVHRGIGFDPNGLDVLANKTARINITTNKIVKRKRTLIARAIRPLIEKSTMSFSGEERQVVYDAIEADNESKKRKLDSTENIKKAIESVATQCI